MSLQPWIRKLSAKLSPCKSDCSGYFLEEPAFRYEAARERMRADRSGSPLSILVIDLPTERATPRDFRYLARVLE